MSMRPKHRHLFLQGVLAALICVVACAEEVMHGRDPAVAALGINLSGPADWNTELPFVDVFRMSRRWISQREGGAWAQGPPLALDAQGWVTQLEAGCYAETLLCTIDGGHYPGGAYTVLYEGEGTLEFRNVKAWHSRSPGRIEVEVDPSKGGFALKLMTSNPENPVRNIRVVMPGFEDSYRDTPFHPAFLARWRGVASLRFMDWMHTNGSDTVSWEDRPKLEDATWSGKGVPPEIMVALANELGAHPWFCMPHGADDGYVRAFAEMVRERLDPSLRVYIEYSNEVWNGIFAQHRYAAERGVALGLAEKPHEAAWRYYARRSVEIFHIWENVFGGTERLVRVLATQSANPYVTRQILPFEAAYKHADALGVAPYVSCNVPREGRSLNAAAVSQWTLERLFAYLEEESLPKTAAHLLEQSELAKTHGLALVAYEGGQHLVGVQGGENDETMTRLFHAANADPRMGALYHRYYQAWTDAGGGLHCAFSSVGRWSKWGSWGLLQHYDDAPQDSPKFVATLAWAQDCGQPMRLQD